MGRKARKRLEENRTAEEITGRARKSRLYEKLTSGKYGVNKQPID
ncbi:MAG: hypothetical protein ABSE25_06225 [Syntrophorhabdales bacterium]